MEILFYIYHQACKAFGTIFLANRVDCGGLASLGKIAIFYGLHRLIIDNLVFVVYPKLGVQMNGNNVCSLIFAIVNIFIAIIILICI